MMGGILVRYRIYPLLPAFLFAQPLLAQQAPPPPVPERLSEDENGVDVAGWNNVSFKWSPIAIGTPGQGGLSLDNYTTGVNSRNNFSADMTVSDQNATSVVATFGGNTTSFSYGNSWDPGTSYSLNEGSSASYTLRDGTTIDYYMPTNYFDIITQSSALLFPAKVTFPSGETWTYNNKTFYPTNPSCCLYFIRPQSITSNRGYQVKFDYASNTISNDSTTWSPWSTVNKITLVNNGYEYCNPTADSCTFSLSWPSVTLTRVPYTTTATNDQGYQWKFVNANLGGGLGQMQVFTPRSTGETLSYITEYYLSPNLGYTTRVKSFTRGGDVWNYGYAISGGTGTLTRTAPDGTTRQYHAYLALPSGAHTTPAFIDWAKNEFASTSNYTYDTYVRILTAQKPEGNSLQAVYDSRGNVTTSTAHSKPGSGLADITQTATYPNDPWCTYKFTCNKPTALVDGRAAQTNITYDNAHGGVLSEMAPPPTAGAPRPLTLTSWTQRYAWVKNAAGTLVQAATPVWVIATQTQCQTAAGSNSPVCDGTAQQTVTTYEYGASGTTDALLVHGKAVSSGGVTLRICYSYDRYARKVSETKPNANLGVCP
jgi:hypothetical protein